MSLDDRIEKLLTIPSHEQPTEDKNDAYQRLFQRAVLMLRRGASIVEVDNSLDHDASRAGLDSMRLAQEARRTVERVQKEAFEEATQLAKAGSDWLAVISKVPQREARTNFSHTTLRL